jgi:hypothetical protein
VVYPGELGPRRESFHASKPRVLGDRVDDGVGDRVGLQHAAADPSAAATVGHGVATLGPLPPLALPAAGRR